MQSIQMTSQGAAHKKSYPMTSELPAKNLPGRQVTDKLVEIFYQKCTFCQSIHYTMKQELLALTN